MAERRASAFVDRSTLGFVLGNLAGVLVERGELDEAAGVIREAAPLLVEPWQVWVVFDHLALFLAKTGRLEAAAEAAGFTDRAYGDHGAVRQPNEQRARESLDALLREALSPRALAISMEDGARLARSDAVSLLAG